MLQALHALTLTLFERKERIEESENRGKSLWRDVRKTTGRAELKERSLFELEPVHMPPPYFSVFIKREEGQDCREMERGQKRQK